MSSEWDMFKERFTECCKKAGSQANLSRLSGIHKNTIYNILKSQTPLNVSGKVMNDIATAVGYRYMWLKQGTLPKIQGTPDGIYSEAEINDAFKILNKLELAMSVEVKRDKLPNTLLAFLGLIRDANHANTPVNMKILKNIVKLSI